ncbi:Uncharacterized protein TCM_016273 [Theobroma cacao]|uniref:Uncharacterized protein n=1 Tax=Theobroma cacao TaxID=3641 RepID=A0A061G6G6_THECC|nr:Uncharacterized protein TCM_016273 [Theobroma cacao]
MILIFLLQMPRRYEAKVSGKAEFGFPACNILASYDFPSASLSLDLAGKGVTRGGLLTSATTEALSYHVLHLENCQWGRRRW